MAKKKPIIYYSKEDFSFIKVGFPATVVVINHPDHPEFTLIHTEPVVSAKQGKFETQEHSYVAKEN